MTSSRNSRINMDFGFVSSPSQSPSQSLFTAGQYFDSTSECSSPNSPRVSRTFAHDYMFLFLTSFKRMSQMMFNSAPMQYDMFQYGATPSSFYAPGQTKMPVEYSSVASIDQTDRRRRRSGSTSAPAAKDKETIPNMHLVSGLILSGQAVLIDLAKATPSSKPRVTACFQRKKREAC